MIRENNSMAIKEMKCVECKWIGFVDVIPNESPKCPNCGLYYSLRLKNYIYRPIITEDFDPDDI